MRFCHRIGLLGLAIFEIKKNDFKYKITIQDLFRVYKGSKTDPKKFRVFVVVSRQVLIDSYFSSVICAPVYSSFNGISTQVSVGVREGLKHDSCIYCDELISIPKSALTYYVGTLSEEKIVELNTALRIALAIENLNQ